MIKLIVIARCIPEDVYLRSIEQPTQQILPGEKRFSIVIRDPETWYVGRLAVEIKTRYENLYKRTFGQIKYLKDGEDDCDLDPELSVADLLVDEGKAARDGSDQKRQVKVIQEQGRAVRDGSVIPDLTPIHYQPPARPPVPIFPTAEKRPLDQAQGRAASPKRRRLGQIDEEEGEHIVRSIEGSTHEQVHGRRSPSQFELPDAQFLSVLNGNFSHDATAAMIKQESPDQPRTWVNPEPASRDELELLPEAPKHWQPRGRSSHSAARVHNHAVADTSPIANGHTPTVNTPTGLPLNPGHDGRRTMDTDTLITPSVSNQPSRTPAGQSVSLLNGLNSASASSILRKPSHTPAQRSRSTGNSLWEPEESDIDDSQMSPRSKAQRANITPARIAPVLVSTDTPRSGGSAKFAKSGKGSIKGQDQTNALETQSKDNSSGNGRIWSRDGFVSLPPQLQPSNKRPRSGSSSRLRDSSSNQGSGGVLSIQGDASSKKHKRLSRGQRQDSSSVSGSRSSSVTSSGPDLDGRGNPTAGFHAESGQDEDEEETSLDSPGAQLEESLRQSSPPKPKAVPIPQSSMVHKPSTSRSASVSNQSIRNSEASEANIRRPPDSDSESLPPLETSNRSVSRAKSQTPSGELRCFTCWTSVRLCDNREPKCSSCEKKKRNCSYYCMTKDEAQKEASDRKEGKAKPPKISRHYSSLRISQDAEHPISSVQRGRKEETEVKKPSNTTKTTKDPAVVRAATPSKAVAGKTQREVNENRVAREILEQPVLNEQNSDTESEEVAHAKSTKARKRTKRDTTKNRIVPGTPPMITPRPAAKVFGNQDGVVATPVRVSGESVKVTDKNAVLNVPSGESNARDRSPNIVLPDGMTREEYLKLVNSRSHITESARKKQKQEAKREVTKKATGKEKARTPSTTQQQSPEMASRQADAGENRLQKSSSARPTPKADVAPQPDRARSSQPTEVTPTPAKTKTGPLKSQSIANGESSTTTTVPSMTKSNTKSRPQPQDPTSKSTPALPENPTNPPFRPQKPQPRKSLPASALMSASTSASVTPKPTAPARPPTIADSKSLKDVRAALSHSRAGSGASTPVPSLLSKKDPPRRVIVRRRDSSSADSDDDSDDNSTSIGRVNQRKKVVDNEEDESTDEGSLDL